MKAKHLLHSESAKAQTLEQNPKSKTSRKTLVPKLTATSKDVEDDPKTKQSTLKQRLITEWLIPESTQKESMLLKDRTNKDSKYYEGRKRHMTNSVGDPPPKKIILSNVDINKELQICTRTLQRASKSPVAASTRKSTSKLVRFSNSDTSNTEATGTIALRPKRSCKKIPDYIGGNPSSIQATHQEKACFEDSPMSIDSPILQMSQSDWEHSDVNDEASPYNCWLVSVAGRYRIPVSEVMRLTNKRGPANFNDVLQLYQEVKDSAKIEKFGDWNEVLEYVRHTLSCPTLKRLPQAPKMKVSMCYTLVKECRRDGIYGHMVVLKAKKVGDLVCTRIIDFQQKLGSVYRVINDRPPYNTKGPFSLIITLNDTYC